MSRIQKVEFDIEDPEKRRNMILLASELVTHFQCDPSLIEDLHKSVDPTKLLASPIYVKLQYRNLVSELGLTLSPEYIYMKAKEQPLSLKFDGRNFRVFLKFLELRLKPQDMSIMSERWHEQNRRAVRIIYSNLDIRHKHFVIGCRHSAWLMVDLLESIYERKFTAFSKTSLLKRFRDYRLQEGGSVSVYISGFLNFLKSFKNYEIEINQNILVNHFINGLPDDFFVDKNELLGENFSSIDNAFFYVSKINHSRTLEKADKGQCN